MNSSLKFNYVYMYAYILDYIYINITRKVPNLSFMTLSLTLKGTAF